MAKKITKLKDYVEWANLNDYVRWLEVGRDILLSIKVSQLTSGQDQRVVSWLHSQPKVKRG